MPNWCYTHMTFSVDKEEFLSELKRLHDAFINQYESNNPIIPIDPGSSDNWIGYMGEIFHVPGIKAPYDDMRYPDEIKNIRGFYENCTEIGITNIGEQRIYYFSVLLYDAWSPKLNMWYYIVENNLPHITISFMCEEPECELYTKYDPVGLFYPENYNFSFEPSVARRFSDFNYKFIKPNHPNSIFTTYDSKMLEDSGIRLEYYYDNTLSFGVWDQRFGSEEQLLNYYNKYIGNANTISEIEGEDGCYVSYYSEEVEGFLSYFD